MRLEHYVSRGHWHDGWCPYLPDCTEMYRISPDCNELNYLIAQDCITGWNRNYIIYRYALISPTYHKLVDSLGNIMLCITVTVH